LDAVVILRHRRIRASADWNACGSFFELDAALPELRLGPDVARARAAQTSSFIDIIIGDQLVRRLE
jgi:hypothetical protein